MNMWNILSELMKNLRHQVKQSSATHTLEIHGITKEGYLRIKLLFMPDNLQEILVKIRGMERTEDNIRKVHHLLRTTKRLDIETMEWSFLPDCQMIADVYIDGKFIMNIINKVQE